MKAALSSYRDNKVNAGLEQDMIGNNQSDYERNSENLRLNKSDGGDFDGRSESGDYVAFSTL